MDLDIATIVSGLVAVIVALDKAGFWWRRKKGDDIAGKIDALQREIAANRLEDAIAHGEIRERLGKMEATIAARTNGSGL